MLLLLLLKAINLVPRAFPTHFLREKPWGRGWKAMPWKVLPQAYMIIEPQTVVFGFLNGRESQTYGQIRRSEWSCEPTKGSNANNQIWRLLTVQQHIKFVFSLYKVVRKLKS